MSKKKKRGFTMSAFEGDEMSHVAMRCYESIRSHLPPGVGYFLVLRRTDGRATVGGNLDPEAVGDVLETMVDLQGNKSGVTS